ncbi:MAG: hypothetical protein ACYCSN_01040 [Acidobacteriaceae bacterium]
MLIAMQVQHSPITTRLAVKVQVHQGAALDVAAPVALTEDQLAGAVRWGSRSVPASSVWLLALAQANGAGKAVEILSSTQPSIGHVILVTDRIFKYEDNKQRTALEYSKDETN